MAYSKEIVLVTGGNSGIGLEIVRKLLREHQHRFHVIVGSRTLSNGQKAAEKLRQDGYDGVEAIQMDVTNRASLDLAAKYVEVNFGKLDVLHVNAGVAPDLADTAHQKSLSELIMIATETNAAGSAATVESFQPLLQKAENPRIIFMSTPMGSCTLAANQQSVMMPAYCASKAAMNMIALYYSKKFLEWKVNACTPGYRATKLVNVGGKPPSGPQPGAVDEGALNAVRLTLLDKQGETGTHTEYDEREGYKSVPW